MQQVFENMSRTWYKYQKYLRRNSRIDCILEIFNLSDRIYQGDITKIEQPIDYTLITPLLKEYRQMSLNFLEQELNCAK